MKDKTLLELIDNYLSCNEREELIDYIKNTEISNTDYKKLALVLINKRLFDYICCTRYKIVIENIDDDEFMNDENNLYI